MCYFDIDHFNGIISVNNVSHDRVLGLFSGEGPKSLIITEQYLDVYYKMRA